MPAPPQPHASEPLRASLSDADDRLRLNHWMALQQGVAPRIRIGRRSRGAPLPNRFGSKPARASRRGGLHSAASWHRAVRAAGLMQSDGQAPQGVYPPSVDSGFPWWLQLQHFLNMFFMLFIMRAGLQILADHPRLYWGCSLGPGTDWFRFQLPVPRGRIWTAKDDSVTLPTWLGIPGLRHTVGLARWWHFSVNLLWLINGIAFYALAIEAGAAMNTVVK